MSDNEEDVEYRTAEELEASKQSIIATKVIDKYKYPNSPEEHEISDKEAGKLLSKLTILQNLKNIEDKMDEIEDEIKKADYKDESVKKELYIKSRMPLLLSDDYLFYLNLVNEHIAELSVELLKEELISEEFEDTNRTQKFLTRRLSQPEREELLLRTGIIDTGLKGEMQKTRELRNEIVHDISSFISMSEFDDILEDAYRAFDAFDKLEVKVIAESGTSLYIEE